MSNTLKFGNGQWATKVGSTLGYNNENGNYKPLPFNFERASGATRVNKDGLIEVVSNNEPRIDFKDNSKGALLLEPQRTNLEANSSEFTGGLIGVSILRDVEPSPDGTISADKLSDNSASGEHLINSSIALSMVSGTDYTCSVFFKADGTGGQGAIRYYNGATFHYAIFNLDTGVVSFNSFGTASIEAYASGWYRCIISFTAGGTYSNPPFQIGIGNASNAFSYAGASNLSHYFWGVQYEQGSYATSYIPTQGGAVTRVADSCSGAGNSQIFNDSEGVLYWEGSTSKADGTYRIINLGNGVNPEFGASLRFDYPVGSNSLSALFYNGAGFTAVISFTLTDITEVNKIAFRYKTNDFGLFVNGVKVGSGLSGATGGVSISELSFNNGVTNNFTGDTKTLQVLPTQTDAQLITLTTL